MTNPTPHGQVPEALRLADELDAVPETGADPQTIQEAASELRRLHAYCQELESQVFLDCMTHVQNPAEIEHVAGDVSKNGAELNMSAAAPTPPAQPAVQQVYATRAAARALSDRFAEMCNVDKEDHWEYHSDDVLSDAELVVSTYLAARAPADSVLEDAGGANWQDISTAPKDGTRFVAVGQNYGLASEKQHTCIAQRLAGCWVEVSDWNGASKLKYLTHWMPLPPLPGSAARKQGANHD